MKAIVVPFHELRRDHGVKRCREERIACGIGGWRESVPVADPRAGWQRSQQWYRQSPQADRAARGWSRPWGWSGDARRCVLARHGDRFLRDLVLRSEIMRTQQPRTMSTRAQPRLRRWNWRRLPNALPCRDRSPPQRQRSALPSVRPRGWDSGYLPSVRAITNEPRPPRRQQSTSTASLVIDGTSQRPWCHLA
jgi:hypothetical protein